VHANCPLGTAALAGQLSHVATQLAVLYKPPVEPTDPAPLLTAANDAAARLVALCDTIPVQLGQTYRRHTRTACELLLAGLVEQASTLLPTPLTLLHPVTAAAASAAYLQRTGLVWSVAEQFARLPTHNADAVVALWAATTPVLDDALAELKTLLDQPRAPERPPSPPAHADGGDGDGDEDDEEEEEEEDALTAREAALATDGLKLMRVLYLLARTLVSRQVGPLAAAATAAGPDAGPLPDALVQWLDHVAAQVSALSSTLDNLTVALAPPQDGEAVRAAALEGGRTGRALVDLATTAPSAAATAGTDAVSTEAALVGRLADELRACVARLAPDVVAR
jgi:hypothetical protein